MEDRCENDEVAQSQQWTIVPPGIGVMRAPTPKWKWDFFGDGYTMMITTCSHVPWWKRLITRIFLGSRWEKL